MFVCFSHSVLKNSFYFIPNVAVDNVYYILIIYFGLYILRWSFRDVFYKMLSFWLKHPLSLQFSNKICRPYCQSDLLCNTVHHLFRLNYWQTTYPVAFFGPLFGQSWYHFKVVQFSNNHVHWENQFQGCFHYLWLVQGQISLLFQCHFWDFFFASCARYIPSGQVLLFVPICKFCAVYPCVFPPFQEPCKPTITLFPPVHVWC